MSLDVHEVGRRFTWVIAFKGALWTDRENVELKKSDVGELYEALSYYQSALEVLIDRGAAEADNE